MSIQQTIEEGWKLYQEGGHATDDPKDAFRAACYHMLAVQDSEEEPDVGVLKLDPKPWLFAYVMEKSQEYRSALNLNNAYIFWPREGYSRNREDYA